MRGAPSPDKEPGPAGCFAGIGIGVVTGAIFVIGAGGARDWLFFLLIAVLAAAPFALLAGAGVSARLPWAVGIGLHMFCWGVLLALVISAQGEGAIISLPLLILVPPFTVSAGALAVAKGTGTLPDA